MSEKQIISFQEDGCMQFNLNACHCCMARVHAGLRLLQLDENVNVQERRLFIFSLCLSCISNENLEMVLSFKHKLM